MTDLINRQEALNEMDTLFKIASETIVIDKNPVCVGVKAARDAIERMPSAHPEHKCETCRYRNLEWHEEPCNSCTMGGESNHYKPQTDLDEWCETCKEYDTEKHCCPRWNRVIRDAVKQIEIIRCKDCRYYRPMEDEDDLCDYRLMQVFEDDFCSRAERRTDEID